MTTEKVLTNFYRIVITAIILVVIYLLKTVLIPFALGGFFAYALTPAARYLNKRGIPWKISVLIIFLGLFIFFIVLTFLLVPATVSQFRSLTSHLPEYTTKIIDITKVLDQRYPTLKISQALEDFLTNFSKNLQSYLTVLLTNIVNFVSLIMS
ncbi:MAG: AI-2E family transporter, partial [Atribacterota bacterium]